MACLLCLTKQNKGDTVGTFHVRSDETVLNFWPVTEFFVVHDLAHYAVESTFQLKNAFLGLMAQGWEINDFEQREPGTPKVVKLPEDAYSAEVLAGLLTRTMGQPPSQQSEYFEWDVRQLSLDEPAIFEARKALDTLQSLVAQFNDMPQGSTLDLPLSWLD